MRLVKFKYGVVRSCIAGMSASDDWIGVAWLGRYNQAWMYIEMTHYIHSNPADHSAEMKPMIDIWKLKVIRVLDFHN